MKNSIPDLNAAVAARLRELMTARRIKSYPAMAAICGTNPSVVSNWLQGYSLPRVPEMSRLCENTGVSLDWIYRGKVA